jgi:hypothetical protein
MAAILDVAVDALRERTSLTKLFRRNACMRHGVPWDEAPTELNVHHEHKHKHETPPVDTSSIVATVTSQLKEDSSLKGPAGPPGPPGPPGPRGQVEQNTDTDVERHGDSPVGNGSAGEGRPAGRFSKWLLPAAVAAGLIGGPAATYYLTRPAAPVTAPVTPPDRGGSLLQYLEDHERHLPGKSP